MNKLLQAGILVLMISFSGYGQDSYPKSVFYKPLSGQTADITLSVSDYDANLIGKLKDELISFEEKVELVHFDVKHQQLRVIYNENMLLSDLVDLFDRYHVNHNKQSATVSPIKNGQQ